MWNFKDDLAKGKQMEVVAMEIISRELGLNLIANPKEKEMDIIIIEKWIEIKLDAYAIHSGNFYIEFECWWKPSWLFREEKLDLRWWWHSNWEELLLLDWKELKEFVLEKIEACRANKSNTSKGFKVIEAWWNWGRTKGLLFPVEEMKKIAKHIFLINN